MKVVAKKAEAELQEAKQEAALAVIAAGVNITKANTLATAATATTIQKGPKKFSGSRGAMAERWVNQIGLYMLASLHLFRDN
ncbi:hypothetical protein MJO28_015527 [Puccinia striiformis f. sp. tritici]|uniref:Uncharacterized protein n=3 Tax=Puccinia striiformis TaxID=27350 RepID=A0A2S4UA16_9BASI|nr:hypothetical protein MJO28_015527 [Puccinia striiformis f. sp. tritici]KAI9624385.1 hypothetical protein KEM48_008968 [Puccinia striiformis f. sp. tritici PST-130]POV94127.1 hypothetical protein PSHT_16411 [Puccinia striiformis]POV97588.1 hypothetical protein PSTT_14976 [Puccinia striiformis]